ncbi:hypothetical protein C8P65_10156 [Capnocytophaga leadbetteri]|jgi:hypothetical protein|uniref:Plasmid stabilization system protein ParE n=1 Tax=Capnocytophaga leadbetteri TaxID=327575 RepID=A0A2T5XXZ6_9FLAO|nr:plasmid stabilization protein ParE [Capnocytophaga leadbetteri]PTX08394.1 hypothetical protein C8P65_10156 [Capnocytophaga leadbetteri]
MGTKDAELRIVWVPRAQMQFLDVLLFWMEKTFSRSYSDKIEAEVEKISNLLKQTPRIGKRVYDFEIVDEELRRVIVLHNFSIYYKIIESRGEIRFIAFWDNRNDPEELDLTEY